MTRRGTTVLIAAPRTDAREELRRQLERRGFEVVATAEDALDAVCAGLAATPQVCLLDMGLPGDALRAAAHLGRQLPGTRVVLLVDSPGPRVEQARPSRLTRAANGDGRDAELRHAVESADAAQPET